MQNKPFLSSVAFLIASACGAADTTPVVDDAESSGVESSTSVSAEENDLAVEGMPTDRPLVRMEHLAELEGDFGKVVFLTRPGFEDEPYSTVVEVAGELPPGAGNIVQALSEDGATPLEIFQALAPDEEASPVLQMHHDETVLQQERDPEVRDYSSLPPVFTEVAFSDCTNFDLTNAFESQGYVVRAEPSGDANKTSIYSNSGAHNHVTVFACSWQTNCPVHVLSEFPARWVTMWACTSGGCGFDDGWVRSCHAGYRIHWNTSSGRTYGVMSERVNSRWSSNGETMIASFQ